MFILRCFLTRAILCVLFARKTKLIFKVLFQTYTPLKGNSSFKRLKPFYTKKRFHVRVYFEKKVVTLSHTTTCYSCTKNNYTGLRSIYILRLSQFKNIDDGRSVQSTHSDTKCVTGKSSGDKN